MNKKYSEEFQIENFPRYKRSPRLIKRVPKENITLESPPAKKEISKTSLAQIIVTPLIMLCITIAVSILMKRGIYVIVSIASTIVSMIASATKYIHDKRDTKIQNEKREELYDKYLLNMRKKIYAEQQAEQEAYSYNYPSAVQIETMINNCSSRIYEKSAGDEDFLSFSAGYREEKVSFKVEYSYKELSLNNDPLEMEAKEICDNLGMIPQKPVVIDLKKAHLGLVGEKEVIHGQLKLILTQLVFAQSYHDLQIINIYNQKYREDFEWMRWFPHMKIQSLNVYGNVDSERMRDQVLGSLHQIIKERKQRVEESRKETRFLPHFVFVIDEPRLIMDHSIMEYLSKEGDNLGFSIIYTSHMRANLPENIGTVILYENSKEGTLLLENKEVRNLHFNLNEPEDIGFETMARNLSMLIHEKGIVSQIPDSITFFQMYHVERPEELQVAKRWEKGESHKSLAVPLGVRGTDDYLYLNLHEKAHGPHGLVAGTTGSGKSEIIQSYILSLAVNFHPYEVGFLLIDYKGGGMAGLFKKLPHLLGTITNLDGSESMRAMASIKSELARRQRIFSENNVNHINAYNKLFKLGEVSEPIPHLFLISDEFAELKKEQPEFMKELVSAARIGRSLGIHLILATQKPAGVVDDQIWTNSRFKLALKVQNEADSKEIIKTPDAASITQPGRAYLQVGNNEIYELFQSAWSGATYTEGKKGTETDARVYLINELGQGELVNGEARQGNGSDKIQATQLDVVIDEIAKVFDEINVPPVKRPWLPPLSQKILSPYTLKPDEIRNREKEEISLDLTIPIGMVDIPEQQTQCEYRINLVKDGNIAFFATAGFGKSTFLETAVLSLAVKNSVEQLNFYICDFGNNALIPLNALPHTCDYITADDRERLTKFMAIIQQEIKKRKKLFAEKMVQNFDVYNQSSKEKLKAIVIVIDNYDIIKELGTETEEFFTKTGRDGLGLGIYLIISAGRSGGVKYTAINNFKNKIAGYLIDQTEITSIVGKSVYKPGEIEGRCLVKMDQVNVMQIYTMVPFKNAVEYNKNLKELTDNIRKMYPTQRAQRIPVLPENFTFTMLSNFENSKQAEIALGLQKSSVELRGLSRLMSPFLIIGDAGKGKTNMMKVIARQAEEKGKVYLFDSKDMELYSFKKEKNICYIEDSDDMEDFMEEIATASSKNKKDFETAVKEGRVVSPKAFYETVESIYILIDDLDDFIAEHQENIKELTTLFKNAVETGIGVIATVHSSKPKGFDELNKWFKTSSNGLVIGSQGTSNVYPMISAKDMPMTGDGLLYVNSVYERLLLPLYE
ncbi:MAG: type VII secretion protein EssC [Lachnospiraceae bacterium]|nr:type VII secretion protein EssC [Lachnospiraceae bacterium]MDD7627468.1 type VII secretion protein EssC [Lachnospiraceae bacterium]MDY4119580.1 type VII secretion protein EssC [Lachnospiraceae bacterium]